jgi:transcriptional regulator with XRE-family HTH domain
VAARAGVSKATVLAAERGDNITIRTLQALCRAYHEEPHELMAPGWEPPRVEIVRGE